MNDTDKVSIAMTQAGVDPTTAARVLDILEGDGGRGHVGTDYISPSEATAIRIFHEPNGRGDDDWMVDGVDAHGNYTESCWSFDTEALARGAIAEFCANNGIDPATPVQTS